MGAGYRTCPGRISTELSTSARDLPPSEDRPDWTWPYTVFLAGLRRPYWHPGADLERGGRNSTLKVNHRDPPRNGSRDCFLKHARQAPVRFYEGLSAHVLKAVLDDRHVIWQKAEATW